MRIPFLAFLLVVLTLCFSSFASAQGQVTFAWEDQPPGTPEVSGYRIYQVVKESPTPEGPEIITYTQQNTEKIPAEARQWTTTKATPGTTWTIRAYNAGGEAPDSEHFTIPAPPAPVPGFKTVALVVESSPDMLKWGIHAVMQVAAIPPQQFFRLRF